MEKFDKHIKATLEERRVVPSEVAWNAIQKELPIHKKTGGIRKYAWGIAASFVGILLISTLFFQLDDKKPTIKETVDKTVVETTPQIESSIVNHSKSHYKESDYKEEKTATNDGFEKHSKDKLVNTEIVEKEAIQPLKEIEMGQPMDIITVKANEVFAHVEKLELMSLVEATDAEVDSLLRIAQEEILAEKIFTDNGKVDAMALLTEVEDELDGSLRDQIFDALKDGYLKLRTAVADRNQ